MPGSILSHKKLKSLFTSTTSNISKDGLDLLSNITSSSISSLITKSSKSKSLFRGTLLRLENILYQHNLYNDWSKVAVKGKVSKGIARIKNQIRRSINNINSF